MRVRYAPAPSGAGAPSDAADAMRAQSASVPVPSIAENGTASPFARLERLLDHAERRPAPGPRQLVHLRRRHEHAPSGAAKERGGVDVALCGRMARVDDEHHGAEHVATAQVVLDHRRPAIALLARHLGVAVAGQVAEAHVARPRRRGGPERHVEELERPRASGRPGDAREPLLASERVQHRGLPDVRATHERELRGRAARPLLLARRGLHELRRDDLNRHVSAPSARRPSAR